MFDGLPPVLFDVWLFILGLCIGSFLNVVIARVPHEQSLVKPRSRCPKCQNQLTWYENIPVFSWLFLRGRCRKCGQPISVRYVVVELLTALLFLACRVRFDWSWELVISLTLVTLLIPLTFIDLEHWILPHVITWPGVVVGVLLSIPLGMPRLIDSAIGAAVGFLVFWAMEFIGEKIFKKEALGGGDKFLLALLGAFLTWKPLLGIIFLSSFQGALVGGLMLLIHGRAGPAPSQPPPPIASSDPPPIEDSPRDPPGGEVPHDEDEEDDWEPGPTNMPFGPWLALSGLEIMFFGPALAGALPDLTARLLGFR